MTFEAAVVRLRVSEIRHVVRFRVRADALSELPTFERLCRSSTTAGPSISDSVARRLATRYPTKPAIARYARHHINEALCQRAADEAGLLAAQSEVLEVGDVEVLISTRYDRFHDGTVWRRVHQEDMCQALSIHPSLKYQFDGGPGVGAIADLLDRLPIEDREVNAERFFKALSYNVLIGATDAHAKNYSLILIGSRAQVSPLYDAVSAAPYDQRERLVSSMKIGDHWRMLDVTDSDWRKVGRRLGISGDQAVAWVAELREQLPAAFERAGASLPVAVQSEAEGMAERIIDHVAGRWKPSRAR